MCQVLSGFVRFCQVLSEKIMVRIKIFVMKIFLFTKLNLSDMKKALLIFSFLLIAGLFSPNFAYVDPLPTLQPSSVSSMYQWRDNDIRIHAVDSHPESTIHCLFEGSSCRF